MSADFTGKNDKQSIFGSINQDQSQDKKSGVLLINCKYSVPICKFVLFPVSAKHTGAKTHILCKKFIF